MKTVCWQTILNKYTYFFRKLGKMSQNLSSAAVVIGTLRVRLNGISYSYELDHSVSVFRVVGRIYPHAFLKK